MDAPQNQDSSWFLEATKASMAAIAGAIAGSYWKRSRQSRKADYPLGWRESLDLLREEMRREFRAVEKHMSDQEEEHDSHGRRLKRLEEQFREFSEALERLKP